MFTRNILPIVILLLAAGSVFMYVYPKYKEISSLKIQDQKFDEAIITAEKVRDISMKISSDIDAISPQDRQKIDVLLPTEINKLRLANDISGIAQSSGVPLENITFTADATTANGNEGAPQGGGELSKLKIGITTTASYQKFKAFIASLESSLQVFDVQTVAISPEIKEPYTYEITMNTYWLPNNNAQ